MLSKFSKILVVPAVFMMAGAFFVSANAKSTIQKLTSKEKAEEAQTATPAGPRITSSLKKHSVGIGLGQTFLKGQFDNNGDDKITADILYNYSASHSFDLLIDFHYSKHKFRQTDVQLLGTAIGIKAKLFNFDAFAPFGVAGLGFYSPKTKRMVNNQLLESESKIVFGTHIGVGADLRLNSKFTIGLLRHYHNPFDVKQEVGPEVEGSYFKLLITGFYSF